MKDDGMFTISDRLEWLAFIAQLTNEEKIKLGEMYLGERTYES